MLTALGGQKNNRLVANACTIQNLSPFFVVAGMNGANTALNRLHQEQQQDLQTT